MMKMTRKKMLICSLILVVAILCCSLGIFAVVASSLPASLSIDYCNLSFRDTVVIKYAVAATNAEDVSLLVWSEPRTEYTVGTEQARLTDSYTDTIDGKEYLVFDYTALTAKQMTDSIYACAYTHVGDTDYYSEVNKYSILQYAYNMLSKADTDAELKTTLTEMLDYGAAAQAQFDYKADRPANGDFYSVTVVGGVLPDGFTEGLYLAGEQVSLTAPATDFEEKGFSYWATSAGGNAGLNATQTVTVGNKNETYTAVYGATSIPSLSAPEPYKVIETYMPKDVSAQMKTLFETTPTSFSAFSASACPFTPLNTSSLSGTRLISISVPVYQVGAADANGDFTLTLSVVGNTAEGMKSVRRSYAIKVGAAEYGLKASSNVYRWLKLDLSAYEIELATDETVAYFSATDTVVPAFVSGDMTKPAMALLRNEFPQGLGFFNKAGTTSLTFSDNSNIIVDFEMERTYESRAAYERVLAAEEEYETMVEAVRAKYSGKQLSILGDSISTYTNVSNNTLFNSTIGSNAVFYNGSTHANVSDFSKTYWGRFLSDADMSLCVNNSWSGSRVYGAAGTGSGNMLDRATQLHNTTNGTTPDLIFVYMGINDLHNDTDVPFGDLYAILSDPTDPRTDREKVDAWLAGVIAQAEATGNTVVQGTTYKSFEQAYALSLRAIAQTYPDADVYCITYTPNADTRCTQAKLDSYGRCVRALAEYFGFGVVDQSQSVMTFENCLSYTGETQGLHYTSWGHQKLEELMIRTLYEDMNR